ncbi:MAG: hypothetical protein V4479_06810 [Actinomycetota bacterium]
MADEPLAWTLLPGEFLGREQRSTIWGGATQGGIQPSSRSANVFIYSDPSRGASFGYSFDGWDANAAIFQYSGEGQSGDQVLSNGNKAILNHKADGRALRVFVAEGIESAGRAVRQRYLGAFEVDELEPYYTVAAPDQFGTIRDMIVFRLKPVGDVLVRDREASDRPIDVDEQVAVEALEEKTAESFAEQIELERMDSPSSMHLALPAVQVSWRREAALVIRFRDYLLSTSRNAIRHRIMPAGQPFATYTDVYVPQTSTLYEAKSDSSRESLRMAVGQLFDYRRSLRADVKLSVLTPSRPSNDLVSFVNGLRIAATYPVLKTAFEMQTSEGRYPA